MSAVTGSRNRVQISGPADEVWAHRSHISIFVRCLHLLNLDSLDDWPAITENTFSSKASQQSLQKRIRAVEWALFRLFEMYSPRETQDKLRPFFPTLTSLQSMNLRAALLRSLTGLKKNGTLGKDLVLRKTMLDDCRGDRFQELLSSFAMLVLRSRSNHKRSWRLSLASAIAAETPPQYRIPLLLAHHVSLHARLTRRQHVKEAAKREVESIAQELTFLKHQKTSALSHVEGASEKQAQAAVHAFERSFSGDRHWTRCILQEGRSAQSKISETVIEAEGDNLGEALSKRIKNYYDEVSRLHRFLASIPIHQDNRRPTGTTRTINQPHLDFSKHKSLTILAQKGSRDTSENRGMGILPRYARLLDSLDAELSPHQQHLLNVKLPSFSLGSPQKEAVNAASQLVQDIEVLHGSPAVEVTPFSASPLIMYDVGTVMSSDPIPSDGMKPMVAPYISTIADLVKGFGREDEEAEQVDENQRNPRLLSSVQNRSMPVNIEMQPQVRPHEFQSSEGRNKEAPDEEVASQKDNERGRAEFEENPTFQCPMSTLTQRTRQSMSLFAAVKGPKSGNRKRTSNHLSQFPVNHFETPERASIRVTPRSPPSGDSTPREKLFSEDAEYASVFKTRTKVALSPLISPDRSLGGSNSPQRNMHELALDEDDAQLAQL